MIGHTIYVVDESGSESRMRWYTSNTDVYQLIVPANDLADAVRLVSNGAVSRINNWHSIRFTTFSPAVTSVETITVVFEEAIVQLPVPTYIAELVPDELSPAEINAILEALAWIVELTPFVGIV